MYVVVNVYGDERYYKRKGDAMRYLRKTPYDCYLFEVLDSGEWEEILDTTIDNIEPDQNRIDWFEGC